MDQDLATAHAAPYKPRRTVVVGVAALAVVALILRLAGIGYMLPHVPQVDEQILYLQVCVEDGLPIPASKRALPFAYPTLIAKALHMVVPRPGDCAATTLEEHLACASREVVAMRVWLTLVAALGVPLLFFLARRLVPDPVALAAAAWLAFSVLHAWYSSQARPHATLCALVVLALIACVDLRRRADARSYVLAGLATALAASTLQSGVFVIPAFVVAHFLRKRGGARHPWLWFAGCLAVVAASVVLFNHHASTDPDAPAPASGGGLMTLLLDKMHGLQLDDFSGHGFAEMVTAIRDYDPWLGAMALLGAAMLVVRALRGGAKTPAARDVAVLLAHGLTHVVAFGLFDRTFQRFLMPVVPHLCLLAAYGVASTARLLVSRTRSARTRGLVQTAVIVLALVPQVFVAVKISWLHCTPDTLTQAAEWIRASVDREHARVAVVPTLELPLLREPDDLPPEAGADRLTFSLWSDYQVGLRGRIDPALTWNLRTVPLANPQLRDRLANDPDGYVADLQADYVVVDVNHDERRQLLGVLRRAVMKHGRLVAHFGPRELTQAEDVPILYQLDGPLAPDARFAWRLARFAAQGPDVEIYAMDR